MSTVLTRMRVEDSETPLSERQQLGLQAKQVLGYGGLAAVVGGASEGLLAVLVGLDILPLTRRSVEAYKLSKATVGMWHRAKLALMWAAVAFTSLVGLTVYAHPGEWSKLTTIVVTTSIVGFVVGCVVSLIYIFNIGDSPDYRIKRSWQSWGLQYYEGNVPEFVLSKALQIKQACPTVTFSVDGLVEERENGRIRPQPDPFLKVTHGSESYYLEVWDEKEFEQAL